MIAIRLAVSEIRRISAGTLPKLAILAMVVIPSLYAGLYLFANEDPYGELHRVPAALVVQDRGATMTDAINGTTEKVDYGDQVADRLLSGDGGFGWVETSEGEAESGVRNGRYDAALIIGPQFSEELTSSARFEPERAGLTLITNDANNYLVTRVAETIVGDVRDTIATQVGTFAAGTFLDGLSVVHTDLTKGVDGAQELVAGSSRLTNGTVELVDGTATLARGAQEAANGSARLESGADELASGTRRIANGASTLSNGLDELKRRTGSLPADTRKLAHGAQEVADGNAKVAAVGDDAAEVAGTVVDQFRASRASLDEGLDALVEQGRMTDAERDALMALFADAEVPVDAVAAQIESAADRLDALSRGSSEVAAGTEKLAAAAPDLTQGVRRAASGGAELASGSARVDRGAQTLARGAGTLADGTEKVANGAERLATSSTALRKGSARLETGTGELRNGLQDGLRKVPDLDKTTARDTAETIGDPVAVKEDTLARAGSYGAGLAPFFLPLAAWIGAYVLFLLVRPLSSRALAANGPATRTALGGWAPPAVVGLVQVAVMFTIVRFALDIAPVYEVATAAVLVIASMSFVAILQALNAWLGEVGEFLGLVLMLVQLVTAGGTFPWETIPEPLRSLHWLLPMSYAVNGLRQTLYGGEAWIVVRDLSVLVGVFVVAIILTALAARRQKVWTPKQLQPELVI
ncbi:YhgE/Pip domain-containing protein [Mumia sp. zg.B17]|uniref:YhgE/Pip domain-containing protein n=1 Tax=Mumia sp. zg.B17 TaxID=2855446 RepID=UPI001C6EEF9A|nr:YhgE/Pip domain-containing protein [Mumia sp. zg.B17]MBW9204399.1 YhgE/Pip domain-containing protein [Mumia sp. zg.B17]